jgi:predicted enzyme related to lactoylglutathione lyase
MATGDICHIELQSTDVPASQAFYSSVFGWRFQTVPEMETYVLFTTPSGLGGGINGGPGVDAPCPTGPVLHVEVSDIDAALQAVEEAGGKILLRKTKISDEFGSFALFLDNVGNRLGLWSP